MHPDLDRRPVECPSFKEAPKCIARLVKLRHFLVYLGKEGVDQDTLSVGILTIGRRPQDVI